MKWLLWIADQLKKLKDIPPLFFRLLLSYGFAGPALVKWHSPNAFAAFLTEMHYPVPYLSAYIAMLTETFGVIFLFFGFATRLISVPLMFMMGVAIATVHIDNGYQPGNNGFAIPLIYGLMLFSLLVTGPGRLSVDAWLKRRHFLPHKNT
ncbi:MAG: DoxX family protein [Verrucomicrobia bacterium]|nr:DoxX family protein [Verrucomicrobiota bacterium]